jgi:hypothetical protein
MSSPHDERRAKGAFIHLVCDSASLIRHSTPVTSSQSSPTWMTFLRGHMSEMTAINYFVVPTVKCEMLFAFIILSHTRRGVFTSTSPRIGLLNGLRSRSSRHSRGGMNRAISYVTEMGSTAPTSAGG